MQRLLVAVQVIHVYSVGDWNASVDDEVVGDVVYFSRAYGVNDRRLAVCDCQGHAGGQGKVGLDGRGSV